MNLSKGAKLVCFFASLTLLSVNEAFARGRLHIRVPDWMEPYMAMFLVFTFFGWLGLLVTKPRGVPVNQLSRIKTSPLVNFLRVFTLTMFMMFMVMLFAGMVLE
ncbi:hypothetical protein AM571_CH00615 [Rhizobium etli 8C-3]|uniref:Tripartite ATP-independent transporter DctQ subunit n=2 Tax=Rhizobium TaxID=379 RepID=A0A4R3RK84_9HYPH|nr:MULTISPECIES: hypothetical protein [Rhizobium]APO73463.1 hypothetical protein AM571_CH00615 [Rhizobium etli 8C-3]TCU26428.1 hypothetical protein EV130_10436 [Rhizobium azibense]TCU31826.1 hypothetical protein EV129_12459 [Rhizobium azibense]